MTDINHSYPFDPTGTKGSNRIVREKHALSPPAWKDYHFIIPKLAPFFRGSLKIRDLNTGRELIEGVDWAASHRFMDASRATARPVYGSITFYDKTLLGVMEIEYQTLGGDWTIDSDLILELLVNTATNPRITTWEEIVDVPHQFPVIDHEYHLDDLVGMSQVKDAIENVGRTIQDTRDVRPIVSSHINNQDNPHQVTKAQIGLGSVEDYPPSTRADALNATSGESYMTPIRVRQSIEKYAYGQLAEHEKLRNNPHQVTKAQVGLGAVVNLGLSTIDQAKNGDGHNSYMTPLRTKQAINAQVRNAYDIHTRNQNNPHQVTKGQVGLGQVENLPPASRDDAVTGMRADRVMTPVRVKEAIQRFGRNYTDQEIVKVVQRVAALEQELATLKGNTALDSHLDDNNPHAVEKSQVGLGNVDNQPLLTLDKVLTGVASQGKLADHESAENPHQVTSAQIGLNNLSNDYYLTTADVSDTINGRDDLA